jgi:site-specific DNA-methyltransferase (adenine-specific)
METNIIHVGDNIENLKKLPDSSVDLCVTSPPYYNLRDYQNSGQLGAEKTVAEFVENLCLVFDEVYRVMKPTGSCWVNIGDSYNNKKLLQVPSRFEIAMSDRGWHLRNEIIWNKPNPQPISSKDRFWTNHEKFFWFVKDVKNYYFNRESILVPQAEISIRRMFSKNNVTKRKDANTSEKEGFSLSSANQDKHYARMREESGITKDFNYEELIRTGKCPMRPEFTVWETASTTYKGAHFAVYPPDLIMKPILSCCPVGGIVIDPFMGSGTTGEVARLNDRNYIGFELNPEYAELAEIRINRGTIDQLAQDPSNALTDALY